MFEEMCAKITSIHNNKEDISLEELEGVVIKFTQSLASKVYSIPSVIVTIVDSDEFCGSYDGYINFKISRQSIKNFKDGKALELMETICHELLHFGQKRSYKIVNIKNSIIEKDNFLKKIIPEYYKTNYNCIMAEIDCFLSQQAEALELLRILNIKPTKEELEASDEIKKDYSFMFQLKDFRKVGESVLDVNDIFQEYFEQEYQNKDEFDIENFLEFSPCINIEYKVVNGCLIRRNKDEINELYNKYKNGTLKLEGDDYQIDTYFQYLISEFDKKESMAKQ